jgi:hypothetical protein
MAQRRVTLTPEAVREFNIGTPVVCRKAPDSGQLQIPACAAWNLKRIAEYYTPTNDDVTCEYCLHDRVRPPDWLAANR